MPDRHTSICRGASCPQQPYNGKSGEVSTGLTLNTTRAVERPKAASVKSQPQGCHELRTHHIMFALGRMMQACLDRLSIH